MSFAQVGIEALVGGSGGSVRSFRDSEGGVGGHTLILTDKGCISQNSNLCGIWLSCLLWLTWYNDQTSRGRPILPVSAHQYPGGRDVNDPRLGRDVYVSSARPGRISLSWSHERAVGRL